MNTLKAEKRSMDIKAKKLRREGYVVGNVFGKKIEGSIPVKFQKLELEKFLKKAHKGSQIMLDVEGTQYDALIKDVAYNPVAGRIDEIDFQALVSTEKVHSVVEVILENHDKIAEGVLQESLEEIAYKALPADLVDEVRVDVGGMKIGDIIRVKDLPIYADKKITIMTDPDAIVAGKVIWHPVDFSLIGYKAVLEYTEFWTSYRNSFIYTISSVVISIIVTLTAAYSLSRPKFPGKAAINMFFVITMFFNGGLIPTFLVMKDIGMYNNPLVMVLMGCVSVWNLMVARTFIQTNIPEELYEASALDGASHFQYFIKVVMPLSKTIIAVLAVYYGVAKWNDYFTGLVYLKDRSLYPLQTVLREILATLQVDMTGDFMTTMSEDASNLAEATRIANVSKYCIIVLATGPVVVLYAFMQKYFEKGVMIGSLKG